MASSAPKKQPRFFSLRLRLLLVFTLLFTVVFAATYFWFYQYSSDTALTKIKDDQLNTIAGAAEQIDTDALLALYREGEPNADGFSDDPRYKANLEILERIHRIEPRAWPGTYILDGDNLVFLTDLWANYDTDKAAGFKAVCEPISCAEGDADTARAIEQAQNAVRLNRIEIKDGIVTDQWGSWSSAWAPIKDKDGNVVGGLFLDFEAAYVYEIQREVEVQIAIAAVISYIIVFGMVYFVSTGLTKPVLDLTKAAERIGEGDYKQDLSHIVNTNLRDEISSLANVFTIMVGKVYQREQTLIKQVEELKIEIDESKRKKQVSEIVDSEFFQELKVKSQAMRRRRIAGEEAPDAPATDQPSEEQSTTDSAS